MPEITQAAPSQETTAAAGAEDHLPAPPPPPEEQKQGETSKDGKDSVRAEEKKPGASHWPRVRSPVLLLLSLFRLRRHGKQSMPIEQPKVSPSAPEDELAAVRKEESDGSKRRRHEAEASSSPAGRKEAPPAEPHQTKRRKSLQRTESVRPPEGVAAAAGEADATPSPMRKKLQKAIVLVKKTLSWYGRHHSPENAEKPEEEEDQSAARKEKGGDTKPSTSPTPPEEAGTKSKQHDKTEEEEKKAKEEAEKATATAKEDARLRLWARAEVRLERILEEACTRLTLAEFMKLGKPATNNDPDDKRQECLLTFSVFPLGSQVKKQAVTYWWCTRFNLSSEKGRGSADETFSKLSAGGFLEAFKNRCSGVIYGCRVNPLVHWMVKHVAREKECADLEEPGGPAFSQPKSDVLCLTAGNRARMQMTKVTPPNKEAVGEPSQSQKLHEDGDSKAQLKPNTTKEPSGGAQAVGHPSQKLHEDGGSKAQLKPDTTKEPSGGSQAVGHPTQKLHEDGDSHDQLKPSPTKPPGGTIAVGRVSPKNCFCAPRPQDKQDKTDDDDETLEIAKLVREFKKKKVILNISAHVYRLPELLLTQLGDGLEVLQLGRWGNTDDETYMEVESLDTLGAIGNLKNLRYLSVRGLSRLTELPAEVRRLRRLAILDVRGCQNLVKLPSSTVKKLVGLTHLDLTECYMLEHVGRGVAALPELRVFKGFVFGVGKRRYDACRLQHLAKLKKLQKLSVNVTTDANVEKDEMKQLGRLAALVSLTVTWGEKPSILLHDSDKVRKQLEGLLNTWTGLRLPPALEKLDVRCYPKDKLPLGTWLNGNKKLKKLYVRGGEVEDLEIPQDNAIETLRLRYLQKFEMGWSELLAKFNKNIKCVEVVDKDSKVTRAQTKGKDIVEAKVVDKVESDGTKKEMTPIRKRMKIPPCTVDEDGVWVRDPKEDTGDQTPGKAEASTGVAGKADKGDDGASKAQKEVKEEEKPSSLEGTHGEKSAPAKDDNAATDEIKKVDSGDKNHETVNKESDNKREAKDEERDPIKNGAQVQESTIDKNKLKVRDEELKEALEKKPSPTLADDQTVAPASDGDIKKGADDKTEQNKISETKEERQDKSGGAKGQDESPTKEDTGGDTNEPQTEGEDKGKDDEQPADEGGGDNGGDASVGDVMSSEASEKTKEATTATLPPAPETTTSPTATPPALAPATTSAAPAAVDSKEPGKAGQEQAPAVENN
ncbi:hypothetical protein ZWY2020_010197 [Hordeum vulgare]|nr:hypothetical protein ZWY2020_010197 [Hordeum vulgare]